MTQVSTILGMPKLDSKYLRPHVIVALKDKLSKVTGIGAVILYGSIIRGEASPKSDIDIMIIPLKNADPSELKNKVTNILHKIESEYDLQNNFSPVFFTGEEDSYFIWEVGKDGVVIYIRPEMVLAPTTNISPYALISYSFTGLDDATKKKTQRFLFKSKSGVKIDMNNKLEYIAPGVLLLPLEKVDQITDFFESNNVKYSLAKVWR